MQRFMAAGFAEMEAFVSIFLAHVDALCHLHAGEAMTDEAVRHKIRDKLSTYRSYIDTCILSLALSVTAHQLEFKKK